MATKKRLLFIYDIEDEDLWKDGLAAAVTLLSKDFEVNKLNLSVRKFSRYYADQSHDFVLGWGAFGSSVDIYIQNRVAGTKDLIEKKQVHWFEKEKYGLCVGGYAPPTRPQTYDVIFYETEWSKQWFTKTHYHTLMIHAFGTNTDIFKPMKAPLLWDYMTVGAFALWKRQHLLTGKSGSKLAVGQIQKNNLQESVDIFGNLLLSGVAISDSVPPEKLAKLYACSKTIYIPADLMGGGERAVLEARACGRKVEVEFDNPKLRELLTGPLYDQHYYAKQLKKGIDTCLK